jgi:hypothetical protein
MPFWNIEVIIAFANLLVNSVQPAKLLWQTIQQRRHISKSPTGKFHGLFSILI